MRLSPIDHIFTGHGAYPINFLFFFKGHLDPEKVRSSLDQAVSLFTPFKSQLVPREGNSFHFQESAQGYGWEFRQTEKTPDLNDLTELADSLRSVRSVPGEPMLRVTLSHQGSNSCLGVSGSHCVVDGYSYFMFLTAWSNLLRGRTPVTPHLDRSVLIPAASTLSVHLSSGETGTPWTEERVFQDTGLSFVAEARPGDQAEVRWEVTDFTKAELDSLYQAASSETSIRLSLNDVLSIELWRRFAKKYQKPGETLTLSCAFDYRRVYSKTGPLYFGNAIRCASIRLGYSELQEARVSDLAVKLNHAVRSIDLSAVESSLRCLESIRLREGLHTMERFHVAHPSTGFLVTNLSRLPLLDLDFGNGAPTDFRILTPARRTAVVLPLVDGLRVQVAI